MDLCIITKSKNKSNSKTWSNKHSPGPCHKPNTKQIIITPVFNTLPVNTQSTPTSSTTSHHLLHSKHHLSQNHHHTSLFPPPTHSTFPICTPNNNKTPKSPLVSIISKKNPKGSLAPKSVDVQDYLFLIQWSQLEVGKAPKTLGSYINQKGRNEELVS